MTVLRPSVKRVTVELGKKSYPIYIGENILHEIGVYVKGLGVGPKVMVVTNPTVRSLYGQIVMDSLINAGFEVFLGEVPDGEEYKSMASAQSLYDIAFESNLDRSSAIIALGGGVIGDLAGFIAATYMRGIPFIQVPTTLLAQVDSSVGGKVAVNHPKGKNIIGAFYQPRMVFADIKTLTTLAERQFRAGMAEVIKYGVIWDKDFFDYLERNYDDITNLNPESVIHIVEKSCSIKAHVVEQDETEQNLRAILNYGHTFGHAFEALTKYKKYVHGEAVAIGMVTAADVSEGLHSLSSDDRDRIEKLVSVYGLPVRYEELNIDNIIESMGHDKKVKAGKVTYILPEQIGRVSITTDIPRQTLVEALTHRSDREKA